jgi:hypothetical protein
VKVAGGTPGVVLAPKEAKLAPSVPALPPVALTAPPVAVSAAPFAIDAPIDADPSVHVPAAPRNLAKQIVRHVAPLIALFFCLLIPLMRDIFFGASPSASEEADADVDTKPYLKIVFDEGPRSREVADTMNFAVHKLDADKPGGSVKLNWYENGFGNSTVVKIDNTDYAFGNAPTHGKWATGSEIGRNAGKYGGKTRTFQFRNAIHVTQTVSVVPSDPVEVAPDQFKRRLDTCFAKFKIENRDHVRHMVGLRILMDTCIGDKDDVPFTIPGVSGLVSTAKELSGRDVPQFVQVVENLSLRDPGIVVQLGLRVGDPAKIEPPSRFRLTRYPAHGRPDPYVLSRWNVPLEDMGDDSAVAIYWDPKEIPANGGVREMAFTYGLGRVDGDGKLALTVGGGMYAGGELTVVALVADPQAKTASLKLPAGLRLLDGQHVEQPVQPMRGGRATPIAWRVHADSAGKHEIAVTLNTGPTKSRKVSISARSLFN